MNFILKWFKKLQPKPKEISVEEFMASEYVKDILKKYGKQTLLLKPQRANSPLPLTESKFGGKPNLNGFETYPCCQYCKAPLNFTLQVYKKDVSVLAYFPEETNLFQIFRCNNNNCTYEGYEEYDVPTYLFYFAYNDDTLKTIPKPEFVFETNGEVINECVLNPTEAFDMPNYADYNDGEEESEYDKTDKLFGTNNSECFIEEYYPQPNTKFNGYPAFTQSPYYPKCSHCNKPKEFFFQLASEDREEGVGYPPPYDQWSAHGIMMGDVGNIYFYVCKTCGPTSIESYFDCH